MKTILVYEFLSAGGLAGEPAEAELMPLGVSMRDAMARDLLQLGAEHVGHVTLADCSAAPADALRQALADEGGADARLRSQRARAGQGALDFLAEQAALHDHVWAVAPETAGLLQQCRAAVGDARWLGSDAQALRIAASKTQTLARLAARGVTTPLDFAGPGQAQRWVVKPDDGAGAVDTRVFDDLAAARADAQRRQDAGQAVTLQPWVEGKAMSLSMMCGTRGRGGLPQAELLSLNRQRIGVAADGQVRFDGVHRISTDPADPRWPQLQALADTVLQALPGLRGFVGIDLVCHAQRGPVVIEVNARVSCAYVGLSVALGRNLAALTLGLRSRRANHGALHVGR